MKISSILKLITASFVVIIVSFVVLVISNQNEREALSAQAAFRQLGLELSGASDFLTNQARAYVQYGEKKYYDNYMREVAVTKTREHVVEELKRLGTPENELALVEKAAELSNSLAELEAGAFKAVQRGDLETARQLIFGTGYEEGKAPILSAMQKFQNTMNGRTSAAAQSAKASANMMLIVFSVSFLATAVVIIVALASINKKMKMIAELADYASRITLGDTDVQIGMESEDEIGILADSFRTMLNAVRQQVVTVQRLVKERTAELALQTSTISSMFAAIPDVMFCKDLNLRYTRCNESFERLFDCREEDILGKNEESALGVPPETVKKLHELEQKVIRGNAAISTEEYVPSANGTTRIFETIRTPLTQDGKPIGIIGIAHDITERKAAEETLKLTLDNLDACIYISEIETDKILFINKRMTEEYGDADCVGKKCWAVMQSGFSERCDFCPVPKLLESGDKDYVWEEHSTLTGKIYRNTDSLIRWHDGRLVHMQHSVDVTDSVLMQGELEKAVSQLERVVKNYDGVIWSVDQDRTITLFDGLHLEEIGVTPSFLEGKSIDLAKQKNRHLDLIEMVERTFESGAQDCISEIGDNIYKSHTTPVKDRDGNIVSVVGNTVDVTEMIRLQNELKAATELAENASKAKGDFLSRMSHEIRTPLNAVIGMAGIAMSTADPERIAHCLSRVDSASKHLLGVINDILDMSKIEAGKFELDPHEFDFEKMLMNIVNVTNFRAEEKEQNFIVKLNRNVPPTVIGDDLRLSQVITNLLSNAVKFTPEGGTVSLSVDKTEDTGEEIVLVIAVEDNGIGITKEQQSRLFTSFEQADGGVARKFGGTGLGLAISKRIVELMGGRIWIESEPGRGSKFAFTVKAAKGSGKEKTRAQLSHKINRDELRILAVDDSPEIRDYFTSVMESLNLPCDVAPGGRQALAMVRDGGDTPYNVFFIDWQMPEMDGIELTRKIKEITSDNSVIFMISVAEWSEIEEEALSAGVKSFVSKPLFPSTLVNVINECLAPEPRRLTGSAADSKSGNRRRYDDHTILIAEDIEINREIMSAVLEDTGITAEYAENGQIAVAMFREHPDRYSLILMDLHMPEMDGYEATRTIRSLRSARAKDIPIVAMTANVFREDIDNCLAAGMNDHIGKPVDQDDMFAKFEKYLTK